jgi:hypothetical protein
MTYCEKSNRTRCDTCGRYMKYMEPGSSWKFVPSSDISYEEIGESCKKCTYTYGRIFPMQNVSLEICSGIIKETK